MKEIRIIMIFLTICFEIIGCSKTSWAANWYVDKDATGLNNGTSWANAWTSFDQIVWPAYGRCPSVTGVCGGDNIYISGGSVSKTYLAKSNGLFSMGGPSGTQGVDDNHRITVATGAKSSNPAGHDGKVIFDGDCKYVWLINAGDYVTLDGEKNGAINWKIQNAGLYEKWEAQAVNFSGEKTVVKYLEVDKAAGGIIAWNQRDGGEIAYCYLHDIRGDFAIAIDNNMNANTYDLAKVHDNIISINSWMDTSGSGPDGIQGVGGLSVYNNTFMHELGEIVMGIAFSNGAHQLSVGDVLSVPSTGATGTVTAISIASGSWASGNAAGSFVLSTLSPSSLWNNGGSSYTGSTQIATLNPGSWWTQHSDFIQGWALYNKYYNNTFRNVTDSSIDMSGDTWEHTYIFNNIFCQDADMPMADPSGPTGIRDSGYSGPTVISDFHVYNNTFVDMHGAGTLNLWAMNPTETMTNFNVKNNIFVNSATTGYSYIVNLHVNGVSPDHASIDRNLVNAGPNGNNYLYFNDVLYTQATGWINNASTNYVPFASYAVRSKTNKYHLRSSDTVARGQGFNLASHCSTIPELCYDKDGVGRPQSGAWDIGAYQFEAGGDTTPPAAPTGLTVN